MNFDRRNAESSSDPSGMFLSLWRAYAHHLSASPLLTKCCTGVAGAVISDVIAQLLASERPRFVPTSNVSSTASVAACNTEGKGQQAEVWTCKEIDRHIDTQFEGYDE